MARQIGELIVGSDGQLYRASNAGCGRDEEDAVAGESCGDEIVVGADGQLYRASELGISFKKGLKSLGRGVKKVGKGTVKVARKTGRVTKKVARKTGRVAKKASKGAVKIAKKGAKFTSKAALFAAKKAAQLAFKPASLIVNKIVLKRTKAVGGTKMAAGIWLGKKIKQRSPKAGGAIVKVMKFAGFNVAGDFDVMGMHYGDMLATQSGAAAPASGSSVALSPQVIANIIKLVPQILTLLTSIFQSANFKESDAAADSPTELPAETPTDLPDGTVASVTESPMADSYAPEYAAEGISPSATEEYPEGEGFTVEEYPAEGVEETSAEEFSAEDISMEGESSSSGWKFLSFRKLV